MLEHELHGKEGIVTVTASGPLRAEDFAELSAQVDGYLAKHDTLQGLMLVVPEFPDWQDFDALVSHFQFVRSHHERIQRVALVSDSHGLIALESIARHFVEAEVEHFSIEEKEAARAWLIRKD